MVREPAAGLVRRRLETVSGDVERPVLEPVDPLVDATGDLVAHPGDPAGQLGCDQGERAEYRGENPDDDDEGSEHPRDPLRNSVDEGPEHGG